MKRQYKTVNEIANLTGITVRTLHYYDEINLLKPSKISETGYRLYSEDDVLILQEILFFKEMGFELKQIKKVLNDPSFDQEAALKKHKEILMLKKERIENLITLVESRLTSPHNLDFSVFDESEIIAKQDDYRKEVLERYKDTQAYKEFESRASNYGDQLVDLDKKAKEIFGEIAELMDCPPSDKKVQELIACWQDYITQNYYHCTIEILQGLGMMYIQDMRFKSYIDHMGENLAQYVSDAIMIYCQKNNA